MNELASTGRHAPATPSALAPRQRPPLRACAPAAATPPKAASAPGRHPLRCAPRLTGRSHNAALVWGGTLPGRVGSRHPLRCAPRLTGCQPGASGRHAAGARWQPPSAPLRSASDRLPTGRVGAAGACLPVHL